MRNRYELLKLAHGPVFSVLKFFFESIQSAIYVFVAATKLKEVRYIHADLI